MINERLLFFQDRSVVTHVHTSASQPSCGISRASSSGYGTIRLLHGALTRVQRAADDGDLYVMHHAQPLGKFIDAHAMPGMAADR